MICFQGKNFRVELEYEKFALKCGHIEHIVSEGGDDEFRRIEIVLSMQDESTFGVIRDYFMDATRPSLEKILEIPESEQFNLLLDAYLLDLQPVVDSLNVFLAKKVMGMGDNMKDVAKNLGLDEKIDPRVFTEAERLIKTILPDKS